jgi:hypothetical protein
MIVAGRLLCTRWLALVAALPWPSFLVGTYLQPDNQTGQKPAALALGETAALVAVPNDPRPPSKCERPALEGASSPHFVSVKVCAARAGLPRNEAMSHPLRGTHPLSAFLCRLLI